MIHHQGRRQILQGAAGLLGALAIPGLSVAAAPMDQRLVVVLLRGGLDGLAAVPPYADPAYRAVRGKLAIEQPLDLDGFFGLHPSLRTLHGLYQQKQLVVFHALASPYRERSHFDAQNLLELGTSTPHARNDGWLNRALSVMGPHASQLGVALAQTPPLILNGTVPVLSWVPGQRRSDADFLERLSHLYAEDPLFQQNLAQAIAAENGADMNGMAGNNRQNILGAQQTDAIARMLGPEASHRIAVVEIGGWDTHANQGGATGMLAGRLEKLDEGLGRLASAMRPVWDRTAILVLTEFGRTVAINGTGGTDHGTGGMALLLGGAVNGGHVLARWPGLAQAQLYQGRDLLPTLDVRAILKCTLQEHLGLSARDLEQMVFPESGKIQAVKGLFLV